MRYRLRAVQKHLDLGAVTFGTESQLNDDLDRVIADLDALLGQAR